MLNKLNPFAMNFLNPVHIYYAWGIVILALLGIALPFLLGARLGPPVKYSFLGHMKILALLVLTFLFPGMFLGTDASGSFGIRLWFTLYSPFFLVLDLSRYCFSVEVFRILKGIAIFLLPFLYSGILVLFDRDIIMGVRKRKEED